MERRRKGVRTRWDEAKVWDALHRLDVCPSAKLLTSPRRPDWCPDLATVRAVTGLNLSEVQERLGWCPRRRGSLPGVGVGRNHDVLTEYYASCRSPMNQ